MAKEEWVVCAVCERAFDRAKSNCPYCGEKVTRCLSWEELRAKHPEYPEKPEEGGYYNTH